MSDPTPVEISSAPAVTGPEGSKRVLGIVPGKRNGARR